MQHSILYIYKERKILNHEGKLNKEKKMREIKLPSRSWIPGIHATVNLRYPTCLGLWPDLFLS
jgi:hypothetical protein